MDGDDSDGQMPDLSMFEDSPMQEPEEEEIAEDGTVSAEESVTPDELDASLESK